MTKKNIENIKEEPKIVKTDINSKNGQDKCPKCGSTDIALNIKTGKLRCNFCHYEFEEEKISGLVSDISELKGQVLASGAQDIKEDVSDIITLKCESCGAEVVIDTKSNKGARCHWCRNTLSLNKQIPNGAIPDVVLPFKVTKEIAKEEIEKFVNKRNFFAHPQFKKEFTTENIMGVYFPYMIVDVNAHVNLTGQAERLVRRYVLRRGDETRTFYDADLFNVEREFDLTIDGLTIESSSDKLNKTSSSKTNNVINAIMPFDTENCVKFNANYLRGYTSEKRDTNVNELQDIVNSQALEIAKFSVKDTLKSYDRGVIWDKENFTTKGNQWQAAYLPVWLYSYQQVTGNKEILHYVAVNARTKETMGSIPIHLPKLFAVSFLVEILGFIIMLFTYDFEYNYIFLLSGFIYFIIMYARYRNSDARHNYEKETKTNMSNLRKVDKFITRREGLPNSRIRSIDNNHIHDRKEFRDMFIDDRRNMGPMRKGPKDRF